MRIDPLDAHDRYTYFNQDRYSIGECCQNLIDQRPFFDHPFYIFAHTRTHEDGVTKILIWQPRLTRPRAEPNSMLFKAYPNSDTVKVIWIIPREELWGQYKKGMMLENKTITESIHNYLHNRIKLEANEEDDLDDQTIDKIYRELSINARKNRSKQDFSVVS